MTDEPLLTPSEWDMVIRLVERTAAIASDNWNGPNEWAPIAAKLKAMRNESGTAPPAGNTTIRRRPAPIETEDFCRICGGPCLRRPRHADGGVW